MVSERKKRIKVKINTFSAVFVSMARLFFPYAILCAGQTTLVGASEASHSSADERNAANLQAKQPEAYAFRKLVSPEDVLTSFGAGSTTRVIVTLNPPLATTGKADHASRAHRRLAIKESQDLIFSRLSPATINLRRRFEDRK